MGTLYIVSTPIGNLSDITLRALLTLKSVDYILCEDTRNTGRLLKTYQINKKMVSFNEFNEDAKSTAVIEDLLKDTKVALVSDAGTPLVSDPGFKLVREAVTKGIKVESIPGPTAAIAALTVSGLATDKFLFLGYLSKKEGKRRETLENIKKVRELLNLTAIIFESPYRVIRTLEDIEDIFGDIDIVICRELTKLHEEIRREKVAESVAHFTGTTPRGEFVILI